MSPLQLYASAALLLEKHPEVQNHNGERPFGMSLPMSSITMKLHMRHHTRAPLPFQLSVCCPFQLVVSQLENVFQKGMSDFLLLPGLDMA